MQETILETMQGLFITFILLIFNAILPIIGARLSSLVKEKVKSETAKRCLLEATEAVKTAVSYVSQTYTDNLKKEGKPLSPASKKKAFEMALIEAQNLMSNEAADFLSKTHGDLAAYLTPKIEAAVKSQK